MPWKLNGLPGLILEVQDRDNDISFMYDKMFLDEEILFKLPVLEGDKYLQPATWKQISRTQE